MSPLARAALVGTARGGDLPLPAELPLEGRTPERRLLLAAGARSVRAAAGPTPARIAQVPPVAPAETLPACSPSAARLLAPLLRGLDADLLPEALARLAGRRLPHGLLPLALGVDEDLQEAVRPLLGTRGPWLAAFNPEWRWVLAPPAPAPEPGTAQLERQLQGGSPAARAAAARTLARRSGSALARRMETRASALLSSGMKTTLPDRLPEDWVRDGILERPPEGMGPKAFWLLQVLSLVPPSTWEDRFGRKPAAMVADIAPDDVVLARALSRAALLHGDPAWAGPLLDWWTGSEDAAVRELRIALLGLLGPEAERHVPFDDPALDALLDVLPPWSEPFSRAWLAALGAHLAQDPDAWALPWLRSLGPASRGLAPATLREAQAVQLPRANHPRARQWRGRLRTFTERVALRRALLEEIP